MQTIFTPELLGPEQGLDEVISTYLSPESTTLNLGIPIPVLQEKMLIRAFTDISCEEALSYIGG